MEETGLCVRACLFVFDKTPAERLADTAVVDSGIGTEKCVVCVSSPWLSFPFLLASDCLHACLCGSSCFYCRSFLLSSADKSTSLLHAPEILMLHVKRFRRGYLWSHKVHNRSGLEGLHLPPQKHVGSPTVLALLFSCCSLQLFYMAVALYSVLRSRVSR